MTLPASKNIHLVKLASSASLLTALILIGLKIWAYMAGGAISVLASTLDSLLDLLASLISFLAIRYAIKPADKEHPFGHGKAEALAGLAQSLFVMSSALFLSISAVERLLNPSAPEALELSLYVMLTSMLLTSGLVLFQRYVIKKTGNLAIRADAAHYWSDLLANGLVIAALLFVSIGVIWMDPLMALAVGVYILYTAYQIAYDAIQLLLDRELDDEVQEQIRVIVLSDEAVEAIHELKTRQSGHISFIQLHVEMDGSMTLKEAHHVADRVMRKLKEQFPDADILIHQDPFDDSKGELPRVTADEIDF